MIDKGEIDLLINAMPGWASDEIKKTVSDLNSKAPTTLDDSVLERLISDSIENIEKILSDKTIRSHIVKRMPIRNSSNTSIAVSIITHNVNRSCMMRVAKYASATTH